jgi:hypothetical protein
MIALVKKLAVAWFQALLFALWSAFCVLIGAGWAYFELVAVLKAEGVL